MDDGRIAAMPLVKWAFIALLLLPAAEIGALMLVAFAIGWLQAVCLFLVTSILGVFVLRRSARRDFDRMRTDFSRHGFAAIRMDNPGIASLIGGILLVFPGFITDFAGAILLVPPLRHRIAVALTRVRGAQRPNVRPNVVDLAPDEWRQVSQTTIDESRKRKPAR
jgi:UPF0716 protein FxsA